MPRSRIMLAAAGLFLASTGTAHAQASTRRAAPPEPGTVRLIVAPTGNEARYRVREQLANRPLENDAIGRTSKVEGAIVVARDGRILSDSSRFVIDLASLETDQPRRDNYVRRNTLQTDSFPTATFVPDSASIRLPAGARLKPGTYTFDLIGRLTLHGVTKPSKWNVTATVAPTGEIRGTATTSFDFDEFNIRQPKIPFVLSIQDTIRLEYDFLLEPSRG